MGESACIFAPILRRTVLCGAFFVLKHNVQHPLLGRSVYFAIFVICGLVSTPAILHLKKTAERRFGHLEIISNLWSCIIIIVSLSYIVNSDYDPFIYFNF